MLHYSEGAPKDLFDAVAAFGYGIRRSHPFVDGDKRASRLSMQVFLVANGIEIAFDAAGAVTCMVKVADGRMSEEDLAAWLRAQSYGNSSAPE